MRHVGFPNGLTIDKARVKRALVKSADAHPAEHTHVYVIEEKAFAKPVDEVSYGELKVSKSARVGIKITSLKHQGKGYGREALTGFIAALFARFNLTTVLIDTLQSKASPSSLRIHGSDRRRGQKSVLDRSGRHGA